ncbi:MAG: hypothetical protein JWO95_2056 [Verrucomicrobiales bacterium]|nr:hypothetical protein [Verrucomicrobiales bacterium]
MSIFELQTSSCEQIGENCALSGSYRLRTFCVMSTAAEIEDTIRQLPASEAKAVANWLQEYLLHSTQPISRAGKSAFEKWRGRGKLPVGRTVDEYLTLTRDANGS